MEARDEAMTKGGRSLVTLRKWSGQDLGQNYGERKMMPRIWVDTQEKIQVETNWAWLSTKLSTKLESWEPSRVGEIQELKTAPECTVTVISIN